MSIISNITCFTSGIIIASSTTPSVSTYISEIFESIDLISLNFAALILGLLLLHKKPELWSKEHSNYHNEESHSNKKVIFENESHDINMDN